MFILVPYCSDEGGCAAWYECLWSRKIRLLRVYDAKSAKLCSFWCLAAATSVAVLLGMSACGAGKLGCCVCMMLKVRYYVHFGALLQRRVRVCCWRSCEACGGYNV